ncbi:MAG: SagB/ThcOx family dehydrogenase [Armatimonadota bacterium]|nr:SagB/ThcOx family dehydrogenase [Armatimonadota bacterium]MDR5696268.1 SagB/ThcOx family dehydrogenase [Armatimonadota bacterium]
MTANEDVRAARTYHEVTKHSYASVRRPGHRLDWANRPLPYKTYPTLDPITLPQDLGPSPTPALAAVMGIPTPLGRSPDLVALAHILRWSAGILRRVRYDSEVVAYRAAPCTGALYHVEVYVACADLVDLPGGLYHFDVPEFALRRLRAGDVRGELAEATAGEGSVAAAPVVLVCTSTFWRNAWKYGARAYRHAFWDTGTMLANLLAVASALGLVARVVLGFVDERVHRLLGVDGRREAAVALVALGASAPAPPAPTVLPLDLPTPPPSRREVEYPEIVRMQEASCLGRAEEVARWRERDGLAQTRDAVGSLVPLPAPNPTLAAAPIEEAIRKRRSTRWFSAEPVSFDHLAAVLHAIGTDLPADFLEPAAALTTAYLIVNAVGGLPAGTYRYLRGHRVLEALRRGDFRAEAGYLALEQSAAAQAAVNIYFMADVEAVLARLGNRGYRAVQLEGGIRGGRTYLAAHALGLRATALTFYDDEVAAFFAPRAPRHSPMFLAVLGRPARPRSP